MPVKGFPIAIIGAEQMGGSEKEKASTLDELIKEKEDELGALRKLRTKRLEIQFFRGISSISTSVATKLEKGETLTSTERQFRQRMFEGLTVKEIISLFIDKVFRRRRAVIFTPRMP